MEKIHRRIARTKPDVVVNFYKLLGGLTNLRYREHIPFIHIGHQFLLNHPDYPFGKSDEQGYLFLRLHAIFNKIGATKTLALSFYPMKDHLSERIAVVPPLIRKEVREVQVRNEDYLLVYILNQGYEEEIRQWHTRHPETWLICFWDKKRAGQAGSRSDTDLLYDRRRKIPSLHGRLQRVCIHCRIRIDL